MSNDTPPPIELDASTVATPDELLEIVKTLSTHLHLDPIILSISGLRSAHTPVTGDPDFDPAHPKKTFAEVYSTLLGKFNPDEFIRLLPVTLNAIFSASQIILTQSFIRSARPSSISPDVDDPDVSDLPKPAQQALHIVSMAELRKIVLKVLDELDSGTHIPVNMKINKAANADDDEEEGEEEDTTTPDLEV